jgi:LmbE family N-acetylglucosaminyl deacetylase
MDHIFFSPHADDAVASCGGTIAQLVMGGKEVSIRTLFCGEAAPPFSPAAEEFHRLWGDPKNVTRLRRAEDEAAAARLGALLCFGDIPEAIYRRDQRGDWLYKEAAQIFSARWPQEDELVPKLIREARECFKLSEARLYFPLGVGCHVDHLVVFAAGQTLLREGFDVVFYEDFPYAFKSSERQQRLVALPNLNCVTVGLHEREMLAKVEAFSYYRSQIPMLFGTYHNMAVEFLDYAKSVSGPDHLFGERFWFDARIGNPFHEHGNVPAQN